MAIRVVDSEHLGKAIVDVLGRAEITLKDRIPSGTLVDFGSGLKEWSFKHTTKFTPSQLYPVIELNPGLFLHYNFFTVNLPTELRDIPIVNLQANLEASDALLNKSCTVKSINGTSVRVDFAGIAKTQTLPVDDRPATFHIKLLLQFPV